jgi:hypothetical protein
MLQPGPVQAIEHLRYYAGWADKIFGKIAPTSGNMQATVYKEPLGETCLSIFRLPLLRLGVPLSHQSISECVLHQNENNFRLYWVVIGRIKAWVLFVEYPQTDKVPWVGCDFERIFLCRSSGTDNTLELSSADVGLEDWASLVRRCVTDHSTPEDPLDCNTLVAFFRSWKFSFG